MTVTDGSRLLAAGHPVTLIDGRSVNVRFGFRGLLMLEEHFGSLPAVQNAISSDGSGKALDPIAHLVAAGLVSEGLGYDDLVDLLDPRFLAEYVAAVGAALEEALPAPAPENGAGKANGRNGSPGKTSTSSGPSASAAQTTTSGE